MKELRERFSPRIFDESVISPQKIEQIMQGARWAPSAYNEQPWFFYVALRQDADAFAAFLDVLSEGNRTWAMTASAVIFSAARRERHRDGRMNDYAFYDTGQAVAHMSIAALQIGLQMHQMQGFSPSKARHALKLPSGMDPVTALAVGRPGTDQTADMAHRTRKELGALYQMCTDAPA